MLSQSCYVHILRYMSVYSRASVECVAILMWFYFHARGPFVSIIIIRLEDGDLLGLMATVMPLCLDIKNNFTTWTFVMSLYYRTRNIRKEIEPRTSVKLNFQYFQRAEWKFD